MKHEQDSKAGKLVTIETANGGDRITAHLFEAPGGLVFADLGWQDSTNAGHPFHYIECEITKGGYVDRKGRRLDIYVEDKPTPERGDRELCWDKIKEFLKEINLQT